MNLTEFKALSDSIQDDREFLEHPNVREIYWGIVEPGRVFYHSSLVAFDFADKSSSLKCCRCGKDFWVDATEGCPIPDYIPGSLADATETLRQVYNKQCNGDRDKSLIMFSHQTTREWFVGLVAAAGGVEIGGKDD